MTMQDPISDMLTRIRNAQMVGKKTTNMPTSRVKEAIAKLLTDEGYISDFKVEKTEKSPVLVLKLKYFDDAPVISQIDRASKPGLRVYRQKDNLPQVKNGLGVAVISTSKGMMTDRTARTQGLGGEILFYIS